MARIRSLKPEFPVSESMGRISREARLCFILLWTLADDAGRLRGHSRALASLLYPFDDDAPGLMDGWLVELEAEGCIRRYHTEGSHYIDIPNWLKHQKIDRPSESRLPAFSEDSASPREPSRAFDADLGPRTKDHGPRTGREDAPAAPAPSRTPKATRLPEGSMLPVEWASWAVGQGHHDPHAEWAKFHDYWIAKAGKDGAKQDWAATWRNWVRRTLESGGGARASPGRASTLDRVMAAMQEPTQ